MSLAGLTIFGALAARSALDPMMSAPKRCEMEQDDHPHNNNDIVVKSSAVTNTGNSTDQLGPTIGAASPSAAVDRGSYVKQASQSIRADESPLNLSDEHFSQDDVTVCQEKALVSLVDGIVRKTGRHVLLYRCVLCSLLYTDLDCVRIHLDEHLFNRPVRTENNVETVNPAASGDRCRQLGLPLNNAEKNSTSAIAADKSTKTRSPGVDEADGTGDAATGNERTTAVVPLDSQMSNVSRAEKADVSPPLSCQQSGNDVPVAQQAEDLSKTFQRRLRPLHARRRSIQSLHCRRPTQRLALVTSEMLASESKDLDDGSAADDVVHPVVGGEVLANAIRQKEQLGDDVTVVIPSDAPLDVTTRPHQQSAIKTEKAVAWNNSVDEMGQQIAHSPVKSIMGYPLVHRKPRVSVAGNGSTTTPIADGPSVSDQEKSSHEVDRTGFTASQMSLINTAAESLQFAGGLPAMFGPLALSTFVNGFGGLVAAASPFLSYYTQMPAGASMASLMAVSGGAPGFPVVTSVPSQSTVIGKDMGDNKPVVDSSSDSCKDTAAGGVDVEEVSNSSESGATWSSDAAMMTGFASSNVKCSSLSRTHSRLNVVRRPIKREDACRPVVLSDGRTAFRCIYCKKDFCTISDVNRHMDFHEDIRPYKCRFCNYYARTNSQLKVHMMRHQGIREYMCRLCNYKGVTQSDLNRHTKSQIHLMKARNECIQCSEGFVSPMNLEQHRQDKHCQLSRTSSTQGISSHSVH